jgi:hypothetical protein
VRAFSIVIDGRVEGGAQTGQSTFFCLASFVLILFLAPPTRFFAAWTQPTDGPPCWSRS